MVVGASSFNEPCACVRELIGSLSGAIDGRDGTRGERKFVVIVYVYMQYR